MYLLCISLSSPFISLSLSCLSLSLSHVSLSHLCIVMDKPLGPYPGMQEIEETELINPINPK